MIQNNELIRRENDKYKAEPLDCKQFLQLADIAHKTQSYLPHKDVSLFELIFLSIKFVHRGYDESDVKERLQLFRDKHYPHGFKLNKKYPQGFICEVVRKWEKPRYEYGYVTRIYNPIEKVAFMKALRACRDYIYTGMNDKAESILIKKLIEVSRLFTEM